MKNENYEKEIIREVGPQRARKRNDSNQSSNSGVLKATRRNSVTSSVTANFTLNDLNARLGFS